MPKDSLFWTDTRHETYSVRSGCYVALKLLLSSNASNSSTHGINPLWKQIWYLAVPSKVKIFLWRLLNEFLPCFANLTTHSLVIPNVYHFCGFGDESSTHIFKDCPWVRSVWLSS